MSSTATNKNAVEDMSQFVCASLDWWAHTDVTMRPPRTCAWGSHTTRERQAGVVTKTFAEFAPVASHQSVAAIERGNQEVACHARAEAVSRGRFQRAVRTDVPCIPWFVRHSAWCVTLYLVTHSGRTPKPRRTSDTLEKRCGDSLGMGARRQEQS